MFVHLIEVRLTVRPNCFPRKWMLLRTGEFVMLRLLELIQIHVSRITGIAMRFQSLV